MKKKYLGFETLIQSTRKNEYDEWLHYKGTSYKEALKELSKHEKGYIIGIIVDDDDYQNNPIIRTKGWGLWAMLKDKTFKIFIEWCNLHHLKPNRYDNLKAFMDYYFKRWKPLFFCFTG